MLFLISFPFSFSFQSYCDHRDLHSFPTRRSSDLRYVVLFRCRHLAAHGGLLRNHPASHGDLENGDEMSADRKSTRLNSSHPSISYAVFCLKKKKTSIALYIGHFSTVVDKRPRP